MKNEKKTADRVKVKDVPSSVLTLGNSYKKDRHDLTLSWLSRFTNGTGKDIF